MAEKHRISAVETGFKVLESLVDHNGGRLTEVAEATDIPTSTADDHLQTLQRLGYVVKDGNVYRASHHLLSLGIKHRNQIPIVPIARPEIEALAATSGEHVVLTVEEEGLGVFMYIARGENALDLDVHAGVHIRLHTTAMGQVILAHMEDERVDEIIEQHGIPALTENTVSSRPALEEIRTHVREKGYCTTTGGEIPGMRSVAAPIVTDGSIKGSVAVAAPKRRITEHYIEDELANHLLQTTNVVEVSLSYY